jgi:hypothetical protein
VERSRAWPLHSAGSAPPCSVAYQGNRRFRAVVGCILAKREPALAEEFKTGGSPLIGFFCLRGIDEFESALPEPRRA